MIELIITFTKSIVDYLYIVVEINRWTGRSWNALMCWRRRRSSNICIAQSFQVWHCFGFDGFQRFHLEIDLFQPNGFHLRLFHFCVCCRKQVFNFPNFLRFGYNLQNSIPWNLPPHRAPLFWLQNIFHWKFFFFVFQNLCFEKNIIVMN
jgi:hypothetical protein